MTLPNKSCTVEPPFSVCSKHAWIQMPIACSFLQAMQWKRRWSRVVREGQTRKLGLVLLFVPWLRSLRVQTREEGCRGRLYDPCFVHGEVGASWIIALNMSLSMYIYIYVHIYLSFQQAWPQARGLPIFVLHKNNSHHLLHSPASTNQTPPKGRTTDQIHFYPIFVSGSVEL